MADGIAFRCFDLHHVGAEIGEKHGAKGSGKESGEIRYLYTPERFVLHKTLLNQSNLIEGPAGPYGRGQSPRV